MKTIKIVKQFSNLVDALIATNTDTTGYKRIIQQDTTWIKNILLLEDGRLYVVNRAPDGLLLFGCYTLGCSCINDTGFVAVTFNETLNEIQVWNETRFARSAISRRALCRLSKEWEDTFSMATGTKLTCAFSTDW